METIFRADPVSRLSLDQSALLGGGISPVVEPSPFGVPLTDLSSALGFSSLGLSGSVNPLLLNQQGIHPIVSTQVQPGFVSPYIHCRSPFGLNPVLAPRALSTPFYGNVYGSWHSQLPIHQAMLGSIYGGIQPHIPGMSPQFIVTPQGLLQRVC